jgi:Resolvase, N terminal domain
VRADGSARGDGKPTGESFVRAAAYVRMSTDLQQYSTENQLSAIMRFAAARGFEVVRVYEDAGKSGLRLESREALQALMADVAAYRDGCSCSWSSTNRMARSRTSNLFVVLLMVALPSQELSPPANPVRCNVTPVAMPIPTIAVLSVRSPIRGSADHPDDPLPTVAGHPDRRSPLLARAAALAPWRAKWRACSLP